eukprot:tig00001056_g6638.t1
MASSRSRRRNVWRLRIYMRPPTFLLALAVGLSLQLLLAPGPAEAASLPAAAVLSTFDVTLSVPPSLCPVLVPASASARGAPAVAFVPAGVVAGVVEGVTAEDAPRLLVTLGSDAFLRSAPAAAGGLPGVSPQRAAFRIEGVPDGSYFLRFELSGYTLPASLEVTVSGGCWRPEAAGASIRVPRPSDAQLLAWAASASASASASGSGSASAARRRLRIRGDAEDGGPARRSLLGAASGSGASANATVPLNATHQATQVGRDLPSLLMTASETASAALVEAFNRTRKPAPVPAAPAAAPLPRSSSLFQFSWREDASRAGVQSSSYLFTGNSSAPPSVEVEGFGAVALPDAPGTDRLLHLHNVVLAPNSTVPWHGELAWRLLEAFKAVPYARPPRRTLWSLVNGTAPALGGRDIAVDGVHVDAFVDAAPRLRRGDGSRRRFHSRRLHRALLLFVSNFGADRAALERVLSERFKLSAPEPASGEAGAALAAGGSGEGAAAFRRLSEAELLLLLTLLEDMPLALLFESARFMWARLFSEGLKSDWAALGGWTGGPSAWATSKPGNVSRFWWPHGVANGTAAASPEEDLCLALAEYVTAPGRLLELARGAERAEFVTRRVRSHASQSSSGDS